MFSYGMTEWILGGEDLERSFQRLASLGYHSFEFSAEPYTMDRRKCKQLMAQYNIACESLCGSYGADRDLSVQNAQGAVQYLIDSVDLAVEMGAKVIIVVPSHGQRSAESQTLSLQKRWENAVKNIRSAADYAGDRGVDLVIEPLNRYETDLVNTTAQALKMAKEIAHPAVGVMADTFHMNIEENDLSSALRRCGKFLKHVHIADSNRAPAGFGHIDFSSVLHTLLEMDYRGGIAMEFICRVSDAFSEAMDQYARASIETMQALERAIRVEKGQEA